MLKIVIASLLLVATAQAFQITYPVGVNPIGSWYLGSGKENCNSEVDPWWRFWAKPKIVCMKDKLMNTYRFSDNEAELLIRQATEFQPKLPGMPAGHFADVNSRKAVCKSADECNCALLLDWCRD